MKSEASVWKPPQLNRNIREAQYICVTGNSGAGKSTLVSRLSEDLFPGQPVIAIDERETHHPFLDLLFHRPQEFSLEMQMNFMLQRVLIARRWLASGINVIMERSHLDDPVFIEYLHAQGFADDHQRGVYYQLWEVLNARTPLPDALVILQVSPEVSIARITSAEDEGLRPREFRSHTHKVEWITGWAKVYAERAAYLVSCPPYQDVTRIFTPEDQYKDILGFVRSRLCSNDQ